MENFNKNGTLFLNLQGLYNMIKIKDLIFHIEYKYGNIY